MRQTMRTIERGSPGVKFYIEFAGKLIHKSIDEVFHTSDCTPE